MKKILSVMLVVVLALALASSAFAFSYDAESGKITGSTDVAFPEIYVNGSVAGSDTLVYDAVAGQTYTIEVYSDGALVSTETITAEAPAPGDDTPAGPGDDTPAGPGDDTPPDSPDGPGPVNPPDDGGNSGGNGGNGGNSGGNGVNGGGVPTTGPSGKDPVPKTGEVDVTAIVIASLSIAAIGMAGVVVGKKYGKEN